MSNKLDKLFLFHHDAAHYISNIEPKWIYNEEYGCHLPWLPVGAECYEIEIDAANLMYKVLSASSVNEHDCRSATIIETSHITPHNYGESVSN